MKVKYFKLAKAKTENPTFERKNKTTTVSRQNFL